MPLILVPKRIVAPSTFVNSYTVYANRYAAMLVEYYDKDATIACTTGGAKIILSPTRKSELKFISVGTAVVTNLLFIEKRFFHYPDLERILKTLPETYLSGTKEIPVTSIEVTVQTRTVLHQFSVVR